MKHIDDFYIRRHSVRRSILVIDNDQSICSLITMDLSGMIIVDNLYSITGVDE